MATPDHIAKTPTRWTSQATPNLPRIRVLSTTQELERSSLGRLERTSLGSLERTRILNSSDLYQKGSGKNTISPIK
jgi:hypothetical protein